MCYFLWIVLWFLKNLWLLQQQSSSAQNKWVHSFITSCCDLGSSWRINICLSLNISAISFFFPLKLQYPNCWISCPMFIRNFYINVNSWIRFLSSWIPKIFWEKKRNLFNSLWKQCHVTALTWNQVQPRRCILLSSFRRQWNFVQVWDDDYFSDCHPAYTHIFFYVNEGLFPVFFPLLGHVPSSGLWAFIFWHGNSGVLNKCTRWTALLF